MLIDSHAHLSASQLNRDRREVAGLVWEAGVRFTFTVETDAASGRQAVAIAHEYPSIYTVVGFHPHNTKDMDGESLRQMQKIGLDFFRIDPKDPCSQRLLSSTC